MHLVKKIKGSKMTTLDETVARVGGLLVEFMRAWWNIEDDMLDQSIMRYGKLCWYRLDKVQNSAINDATMMSFIMLSMMQKYFRDLPCYDEIVNYLYRMNLVTAFGQYLDETFTHQSKTEAGSRINWSLYTMENYMKGVEFKTGNFDVISIRLGLYLCNIENPLVHKKAQEIALKIGLLDQVSDDFIDVFIDESIIGSSGTDIEEAKMSWLVLTALKRAKGEERKILETHYGRKDAESIEKIKNLYIKLDIPAAYADFQIELCQEILDSIESWNENDMLVPKSIFPPIFSNIYANGANLAF